MGRGSIVEKTSESTVLNDRPISTPRRSLVDRERPYPDLEGFGKFSIIKLRVRESPE